MVLGCDGWPRRLWTVGGGEEEGVELLVKGACEFFMRRVGRGERVKGREAAVTFRVSVKCSTLR